MAEGGTPSTVDAEISNAWATVDGMIDWAVAFLPKLAIGVVVFVLFWLIGKGVRAGVRRAMADRPGRNVGLVLGRLAQGALNLLGLLVAVTIMFPSVRPVDLLSLLGISGVAIGFAFKDVLQNFLAGILILLRQPFVVGDQIRYKDFEGTVEDIETRTTVIRTYDGRRVFIPNGEIFTNAVTVNTAYEARRSEHDVGIGYGDDPERAAALMVEVMRGIEGVWQHPPPEALVMALGASSVDLRARWWTDPRQHEVLKVRSRVVVAIRKRLVAEGIDLPFPTNMVLFHDQTEETDGDRTRQREGWPPGGRAPKPRTIAGTLERRDQDRDAR